MGMDLPNLLDLMFSRADFFESYYYLGVLCALRGE